MSASSSNERKRLRSLDNVASAAFPPSKRSPQGPLSEHQTTFPDPQVMKTMKILGTHAVNDPVCLPTVIEFLRANLPEGDPEADRQWSEITTAMAFITEDLRA